MHGDLGNDVGQRQIVLGDFHEFLTDLAHLVDAEPGIGHHQGEQQGHTGDDPERDEAE